MKPRIWIRLWRWFVSSRDKGVRESLRDYERREMSQGWEGPRWRLPAELRDLNRKD